MRGDDQVAAAVGIDRPLSGTDARQQSSDFADGAHRPFRQHFAASLGEVPNARQSSDPINVTMTSTLTAVKHIRRIRTEILKGN
jgi:hypothetical protein